MSGKTEYLVEIQSQSATMVTHALETGKRYVIGRSETADLRVAGDPYISREHVEVCVEGSQLVVSRRSMATNPIVFKGAPTSACVLKTGEEVTIGQSSLRFRTVVHQATSTLGIDLYSWDKNPDASHFIGLIDDIIARSLALDAMQEKQLRLGNFFSPRLPTRLLQGDEQVDLKPRIAESTVLFFDIRDFSKRTQGAVENLLAYQGELRRVMSAMTETVFEENGVVIQYMGDGIMAAWNVPVEDALHVDCACRAALKMVSRIGQVAEGWRCGIGLDVGSVVAGAMGSDQVYSYGIMGPVVNQASRIEGITKVVGAPILVAEPVAKRVSAKVGLPRRIGRFQLAGFTVPVDLFELLPPPGDPKEEQEIYDNISLTNQGLEAFERGEWDKAAKCFRKLPEDDSPASFLLYLAMDNARRPPRDWHGVIELKEK